MDSLQQIKLERQTKEELQANEENLSREKLIRYDEVSDEFGAKNPAELDLWRTVWDEYNHDYDVGIPENALSGATMQAHGMRKEEAERAIDIGKEFELLIEATPQEELQPELDEDSTILRPVLPRERPNLYVDNAAEYADRNVWRGIWDNPIFDKDDTIPEETLIGFCKDTFDCQNESEAAALIAVGVMCGALQEEADGYTLSSERPDQFWIEVWNKNGQEVDETLTDKYVISGIKLVGDYELDEAINRFDEAKGNYEIYSPQNIPNNEYLINDPSSDDGPPILTDDDGPSDEHTPTDSTDQTTTTTETDPAATNSEDSRDDSSNTQDAITDTDERGSGSTSDEAKSKDTSATTLSDSTVPKVEPTDAGSSRFEDEPTDSDSNNGYPQNEQIDNETQINIKDGEHGERTDADERESTRSDSPANEQSSDPDRAPDGVATDVEGGFTLDELDEEMGENAPDVDTTPADSDDHSEHPNTDSDDDLTRFQTYEEPDIDNPAFDVDVDATNQFIQDFLVIDPSDNEDKGVPQNKVFNVFSKWAKINNIDLNEITEDKTIDKRKGNLKRILLDLTEIDTGRPSIDGERTRVYYSTELSDLGNELYQSDV